MPGWQRGGGPGRPRTLRGHRHLPDHAGVADGRGRRRLELVGADRTSGAAYPRSWPCSPRRGPPGPCTGRSLKGALATTFTVVSGPAADGAQPLQAGGRTVTGRGPRGCPGGGHPRPVDLRRPQRRHGGPHDGDGHAVLLLGPGGPRLRGRGPRRHPPLAGALPALLRRLPHLPRDEPGRACSATTICWLWSGRRTSLDHRLRGMDPDRPVLRGSAQNPDVFFQAREAANPFHAAVPGVVEEIFAELADRTGRRYGLVEYQGHPEAERALVIMGSGAGAAGEAVDAMVADGQKVGLLTVRLFRPFPADRPDRGAAGRRSCRLGRPGPDQGAGLGRGAALPRRPGRPGRGPGCWCRAAVARRGRCPLRPRLQGVHPGRRQGPLRRAGRGPPADPTSPSGSSTT